MSSKKVYLSLGSNLGQRERYLADAISLLQDSDSAVLRASSIYETEPRDLLHQPWFLNQVIEVDTRLFPRQLLSRIKKVEDQLGRKRKVDKGPRTIDIDILLFGRFVVDVPGLMVPHPRMSARRFVLEPLAELAPDLRHPVTHETVRDLLVRVSSQKLRKLSVESGAA